MNEVEKMYETIFGEFAPNCSLCAKLVECEIINNTHNCNKYQCDYKRLFTAEKQLEIENVILQNKKNYNKWIEYNINVYGEWVIRFVRTDKFAPYIALEKTRAEAFANVINHFWQDLTEEERKQIKEILE